VYDTILWATDGSSHADGALPAALDLLAPNGRLVVFHCDERFTGGRSGGAPLLADETDRLVKLRAQVSALRDEGVDVELVVTTTRRSTVGEIVRTAEIYEADAIVCGTRGFGIVAGALAGSVAMRLPHLASCPVVVVSEQAADRSPLTVR
jgi:nucleotide-binding universal stress UspA family protein